MERKRDKERGHADDGVWALRRVNINCDCLKKREEKPSRESQSAVQMSNSIYAVLFHCCISLYLRYARKGFVLNSGIRSSYKFISLPQAFVLTIR